MNSRRRQGKGSVDRLGMFASGFCALHCAASALIPGVLGALGLGALLGHEAERWLVFTAVGVASVALVLGWLKHRSYAVIAILLAGIGGLALAQQLEASESHVVGTVISVLAGVTLIIGHAANVYATRRCAVRGA